MRHQLRFPLVEQLFILTRFAHSSSCSGVKGFHQFPTFQLRICPPLTLWTDGGGKTKTAALRPIRGRDAVARMSLGSKRFWPENYRVELGEVNGQVAMIIRAGGQAFSVLTIEVEEGHIQTIRVIANPEKLTRI